MKFLTALFLLSSAISTAQAESTTLITPVAVSGTGNYNNSPDLIIDGVFPAEGSIWTGATNVHWVGSTPVFTLDLGSIYQITDVTLSIDNNDDYVLQWSANSVAWENLFTISKFYGEIGSGMDTMSTDHNNPEYIPGLDFSVVQAQYLRFFATGGDNLYSVGEIQAFGSPVPVPAAAWLFGSGLIGLFRIGSRVRQPA